MHLHLRTDRVAVDVETKCGEEVARSGVEGRSIFRPPLQGLLRSGMRCQRGQSWKLTSQKMGDSNKVGRDSRPPGVYAREYEFRWAEERCSAQAREVRQPCHRKLYIKVPVYNPSFLPFVRTVVLCLSLHFASMCCFLE